jgi:hypothetical protein
VSMTRLGSVLAAALMVSGCLQRPGSSVSGGTSDGAAWDESSTFEAGGEQLVMTGPVLHRSADAAPGAPQVLSRRCYFISLGIGFLVELDAGERALHDGTPTLESVWQPEQLAPSGLCERAFGVDFRLPTSNEADAWLARKGQGGPIFTQDAGQLGSVQREVRRCEYFDGCPATRPVHGSPQPAMLQCVGPLQARANVVPSETEVRSCVAAFGGVDASQDGKLGPLDPGSLDVVLSARRACVSGGAAHQQFIHTLRRHVGSGTLAAFTHEIWGDLRRATEARATSQSVLSRLSSEPNSLDCATTPASYQRVCRDPLARDCLLVQARFAQQCQQIDAASQLASAANDWAAEVTRLAALQHRASTLTRAAGAAVRCSERGPAAREVRRALRDVLGAAPAPSTVSYPICACPIEDFACGMAALRTRGICPEDRVGYGTRGGG